MNFDRCRVVGRGKLRKALGSILASPSIRWAAADWQMGSTRVFVDLRLRDFSEGVLKDFDALTALLNDHGSSSDEENNTDSSPASDKEASLARNSDTAPREEGETDNLPQVGLRIFIVL